MKRVACTIVSANYLHFAWTLAESFLLQHPHDEFHLLLVDRLPEGFSPRDPRVHLVEVEKLGMPDFRSIAFKFDILELNTGVKPSFLKYLFELGANKIIYFDPDIYIFRNLECIYDLLDAAAIVLTPHILSPTLDAEHRYERELLGTGVFNLGFIAVSDSAQSLSFLDWWEERCLQYCFQDLRAGLFVDQRWIDLAPCLFDRIHVLRDPGCNVAYWNLRERSLSECNGRYLVDEVSPLTFFHYSGYTPSLPDRLSRNARVPVVIDLSLGKLLHFYGQRLKANGYTEYEKLNYAFARFSDGSLISSIMRRLYSISPERWGKQDPFDVNGAFYAAVKMAGLLSVRDRSGHYNSENLPVDDWRIKTINRFLFSLPKLIGGDNYTMLMKYLSFISILRNQPQLLGSDQAFPVKSGQPEFNSES